MKKEIVKKALRITIPILVAGIILLFIYIIFSVPKGNTYEEKKANYFRLIQALEPGISEIIFHPSIETEGLKRITNSWQQRVWEAKMFSDPDVIQFMIDEDIVFTNWKKIMERFKENIHG